MTNVMVMILIQTFTMLLLNKVIVVVFSLAFIFIIASICVVYKKNCLADIVYGFQI